jgi:hypothetical protein
MKTLANRWYAILALIAVLVSSLAIGTLNAAIARADTTANVHVVAFVNGSMATASSTGGAFFPISSTWNSTNAGAGTDIFFLTSTSTTPYMVTTADFASGASYSIFSVLGNTVGAMCNGTTTPFALQGYSTGPTLEAAATSTVSSTEPNFTNLTQTQYAIVWLTDCNTATTTPATSTPLAVTSITTQQGSATANGSFESGWKFLFAITVPDAETHLAMKFNDWSGSAGTIPAANNIRISSAQASTAGTASITAANTYSSELTLTGDMDSAMPGRQVQVLVEAAVPAGTANGTYSTGYGVRTQ